MNIATVAPITTTGVTSRPQSPAQRTDQGNSGQQGVAPITPPLNPQSISVIPPTRTTNIQKVRDDYKGFWEFHLRYTHASDGRNCVLNADKILEKYGVSLLTDLSDAEIARRHEAVTHYAQSFVDLVQTTPFKDKVSPFSISAFKSLALRLETLPPLGDYNVQVVPFVEYSQRRLSPISGNGLALDSGAGSLIFLNQSRPEFSILRRVEDYEIGC